jgi:hypothetical protein
MAKIEKTGAVGTEASVVIERAGTPRSAAAALLEGRSSFMRASTLEEEFQELAVRWREETEHLSSTSVFTHPVYQRIIGLGAPAVPLLLRDMIQTEAHWFWALRAITGENPVDAADAGNVRKMIDAWRAWGASRGLL